MAVVVVSVNKKSESFPSVLLNELLKHCNDYATLKSIQLSTSALNDLFTCPSQYIWRQLCNRNRYTFLLKREARCLLRGKNLIWESIYYQNWKVDINWSNRNCELITLKGSLIRMITGSLGVSIPIDPTDNSISICDFKRDALKIFSKKVNGQVTSSTTQGNILVLGMNCGSMIIFRIFPSKNEVDKEWTVKYHSKEISSIILDPRREFIISGDISGQVIKSNLTRNLDDSIIILYQCDSSVTGLLLKDEILFITTMNGSLIKISINGDTKKIVERFNFDLYGSINCITAYKSDSIVMGTDSGKLIIVSKTGNRHKVENLSESPIISLAASSKRLAAGHFDGNITVVTGTERTLFRGSGPVWSVAIDETTLISSSINGETVIRNFL